MPQIQAVTSTDTAVMFLDVAQVGSRQVDAEQILAFRLARSELVTHAAGTLA